MNPNDLTVDEQEVQAEIVDAWPQESAQITSLRRRAAAGTLKVGLLNLKPTTDIGEWKFLAASKRPVSVPFRRASKHVSWKNLFPEWIDEEAKFGDPRCPFYPMPKIPAVPYVSRTIQLDVVIARAPCAEPTTLQEGWKHPAILQVFPPSLPKLMLIVYLTRYQDDLLIKVILLGVNCPHIHCKMCNRKYE